MDTDLATPIPLEVWRDPQGFVLTEHVRDEAWCYFQCLTETGPDLQRIGRLHFTGVWHLESTRFRPTKGYPRVADTELRSYYLCVERSSLLDGLKEARTAHDPDWRRFDRREYRHWVVESHDFYISIIAADVTFHILEGEQAMPYFTIWDQV